MAATTDLGLKVLNHATGQPKLTVGETAQLDVTLTNNGPGAVTLKSAGTPSVLKIFPPFFFTADDIARMSIANAGGDWHAEQPQRAFLQLTYVGADGAGWTAGSDIAFSIAGARSAGPARPGSLQINAVNMGNVPRQVPAPLALEDPPQQGNARLTDVLEVTLNQPAVVFVSQPEWASPLANTLVLDIMNVGNTDLYTGTEMWTGQPQVMVKFVYGRTSGALAPDDGTPQPGKGPTGSAWNILGYPGVDETAGWSIDGPNSSNQDPEPSWTLAPSSQTNKAILGTGAHASVTFIFANIISFTPPGPTQMLVQFSGFRKNARTAYDQATFILPISKTDPPPVSVKLELLGPTTVGMNGLAKLKWDAPSADYCMLDDGTRLPASGTGYFLVPKTRAFTVNAFRSGSDPAQDQRTVIVDHTIAPTEAGFTRVGGPGRRGGVGLDGSDKGAATGGPGGPGGDAVFSGSLPPLATTDYPGRVIPITLTGGPGGTGGQGGTVWDRSDPMGPWPYPQAGGRGGNGGSAILNVTLDDGTQPAQYLINVQAGPGGAGGPGSQVNGDGGSLGPGSPGPQSITIDGVVVAPTGT